MRSSITFLIGFLFSIQAIGQTFNKIENGHLVGKINIEGLSDTPFESWFTKGVATYTPEAKSVSELKNQLPKYTIKAFMGTWCGDSKREIPKLYSVLQKAQFPLDRLTMIAVARERDVYKQSPGGEHEGLNIHRVPTIIVYENGKEVNRIVESPVNSIENDLLKITKNTYVSNHLIVTEVDQMIANMGVEKFNKKLKRTAGKIKELAENPYQLNTYASVLFYAGQKDKALAALRLNAELFPNEAMVYSNLGNKLVAMDRKKEAIQLYTKVLEKDPKNEKIQDLLSKISEKI